jgi:hypothetical protein
MMDSMSTTPDVPGAPGKDCEEEKSSLSAVAGPQGTGADTEKATEEDWLATGDPAFWLKE